MNADSDACIMYIYMIIYVCHTCYGSEGLCKRMHFTYTCKSLECIHVHAYCILLQLDTRAHAGTHVAPEGSLKG